MNLSDILPDIKAQIATMEERLATGTPLGLFMAAQMAGSNVAIAGEAINQMIAGAISASEAEEAELRELYDALLTRRAEIDTGT